MPNTIGLTRRFFIAAFLATATPALAHHGWAWTSDDWFELSGTITDIYIGNPHVTIEVDAEGTIWEVDLAPLSRTLNAGFDENAAAVGDQVTLIGHRAIDAAENHMKAVRVIVRGETYDVYPGRAGQLES